MKFKMGNPLEMQVLRILWGASTRPDGWMTAVEVQQCLLSTTQFRYAYTTVKTALDRLCCKGFVESVKGLKFYSYKATDSRDEAISEMLEYVSTIAYGTVDLDNLTSFLMARCMREVLKSNTLADPDELAPDVAVLPEVLLGDDKPTS
jgi:predicted transcriptional regulator